MKSLLIIISICLLPCIKLHAQLPSSKPMQLEKYMAYKKNGNTAPPVANPTSLPSEATEYPERVREIMKLWLVRRSVSPQLNSLPSTRKIDFDALMKKYKKI
jgi:hypothetical protein